MKVLNICLSMLIVFGFYGNSSSGTKTAYECKKISYKKGISTQEPWINVYIHGVNLFGYNCYDLGLHPVNEIKRNRSLRRVGNILLDMHPTYFTPDTLFMFSWSGSLGLDECEAAAAHLGRSLEKVITNYAKTHNNVRPKLRIMTFSYGGNVALSLPKVHNSIIVDELIIIGYPVQKELCNSVSSPMFKRVFNLYSIGDAVQLIDPQGAVCRISSCPFFSTKRFCESDNLIQTRVMLNGIAFGHFYFLSRRFLCLVPQVIEQLNAWFDAKGARPQNNRKLIYNLSLYSNVTRNLSTKK